MSYSAGVDGCAWSGGLTRSTSLLPPGCQESHQRGVASDITKLADLGKQLLSFLLPLFPSPPELFAKVFRHARLRSLLALWRALLQPQPFIVNSEIKWFWHAFGATKPNPAELSQRNQGS